MERVMRYNDFQHDVMSDIPNCTTCAPENNSWLSIAARGDLVVKNPVLPNNSAYADSFTKSLSGAIDAKITSYAMIKNSKAARARPQEAPPDERLGLTSMYLSSTSHMTRIRQKGHMT